MSTWRHRGRGRPDAAPTGPVPGAASVGVNVVGYLDRTSGLAERARVLVDVLRAAGVEVAEWPVTTTASPVGEARAAAAAATCHDTTIAVVTAPQFPGLVTSNPAPMAAGRVIGYWFWEVALVPPEHRAAIELVDEIWAPTAFVRDAYAAVTDTPVRLVPLPIQRPVAADVTRHDVGLDDRFTFLVSFDHLSVMERKHPLGAIEAFVRAFPAGDEPVRLLVKSINGSVRPNRHATLLAAAGRDPRIDVVDAHAPEAEHMALLAHADCYVSLHRSEGLGLQPAAAMWLGTPVIASRYSGTLDLMDDDSAELVDVALIAARNTDGAYPPDAVWADPDLDQAADAMRRLATDADRRAAIVAAARARREADADLAAAASAVHDALTGPPAAARQATPVASVAPMSEPAVDPGISPVPAASGGVKGEVKKVARVTTAPVRNYINNHFEMVKQEVRSQVADGGRIADLVYELEAAMAEANVHHARTIARLQEETRELTARIGELERVIERLTAVVAASLDRPDA